MYASAKVYVDAYFIVLMNLVCVHFVFLYSWGVKCKGCVAILL